jgi:hypothetical protein
VLVLAVLASVAVVLALGAGADAKRSPKPPPVRYGYTVEVAFQGKHELEASRGGELWQKRDATTAWIGKSGPFALVNRGTTSKPSIRVVPYGGSTLPVIRLAGFLEHDGQGGARGTAGAGTCWVMQTEEATDAQARVALTLVANRLRISMQSEGTVVVRSLGCGVDAEAGCDSCLVVPRDDAGGAAWWAKVGGVDQASDPKIRLGRAFTLKRRRDPVTDPTLEQAFPAPLTGQQRWFYEWTLRFRPLPRER